MMVLCYHFFYFEENSNLLLILSEVFSCHLIAMHVDVIVRSTKKARLSFVYNFTYANANFGGEDLVGTFLSSFVFFLLCNCVKSIQKVKSFLFFFFFFLLKNYSIATGQSQFTWLIDCLFPIVSLVHKRMILSSIPFRLQMLITSHIQTAKWCLSGIIYQEG